jgi:thimet oligopeptidase
MALTLFLSSSRGCSVTKRIAFLLVGAIIVVASPRPAVAAVDGIDWHPTAAALTSTCNASIAKLKTRVAAIVHQRSRPTFATVVLPLENAEADLNDETVAQTFLFNVSPEKAVRQASLDCGTAENNLFAELTADPQLYKAVDAAAKSNTARTPYDKKLIELYLTSLKRSGAGLPPAKRAEYVKLENQLTDLQNKFQQNLGEDSTTITITQAQTAGIPSDVLASYKKNANGTYTVPVNESTVSFSRNAASEDARKAYYLAYNNRQAPANVALLEAAIGVRDRLAHLMGYETWADYVLADRMASSTPRVEKFLADLDRTIVPKAQDEIEELRQLKAQETHNPQAVLEPWDVARYQFILQKTKYSIDSDAIRQYFPVQHTIDSVLDIYHTLLGVTFTQVTPSDAWVPEVLEYKVTDTASGALLGYTYFDLYPRPGKYDHFANWPLVPVRAVHGSTRTPIAAILGNWPKPGPGQPALLSHDDVITFFHEFGHNMAALLATAPYETLSAGFRQDFVEAPSQMLENFVWQPAILKQISSNWKTGEPLPDDLIAKLIATRYVDYAYGTTRQILYATVDMRYHSMGPRVDTTAVWEQTAKDVSPMPMYPGTHPQAAFGHVMSGYDAGYYGYLWSKVYAQDMFTAFAQGGLENPAIGKRYRTSILAPARTYEPDALVRAFLGRPMNPNAFYSEFGIAPNSTMSSGTKP